MAIKRTVVGIKGKKDTKQNKKVIEVGCIEDMIEKELRGGQGGKEARHG